MADQLAEMVAETFTICTFVGGTYLHDHPTPTQSSSSLALPLQVPTVPQAPVLLCNRYPPRGKNIGSEFTDNGKNNVNPLLFHRKSKTNFFFILKMKKKTRSSITEKVKKIP